MILTHIRAVELTHCVDALQEPCAGRIFIQIIAGLLNAGDSGEDLGFNVRIAYILVLFIRAILPWAHPRTQSQHIVQFGTGDNPCQTLHLVFIHRRVIADLKSTALSSPQVTLAMCFISLIGRPLRVKFTCA